MKLGLKLEHTDMGISQIIKEAQNLVGTFGLNLDHNSGHSNEFQNSFSMPKKSMSLPTAFDPRSVSNWTPCIHGVRDQSTCGSCWAFAGAGMLEDRICIASS
jgi:C1A family cysteine protease